MPRAVCPQGGRQRLLLDRDAVALLVDRAEFVNPVLRRHGAALLEAPAEQRTGGLVVEDDVAWLVHEDGGGRQRGDQIAGEDELERPLRRSFHGVTLTKAE